MLLTYKNPVYQKQKYGHELKGEALLKVIKSDEWVKQIPLDKLGSEEDKEENHEEDNHIEEDRPHKPKFEEDDEGFFDDDEDEEEFETKENEDDEDFFDTDEEEEETEEPTDEKPEVSLGELEKLFGESSADKPKEPEMTRESISALVPDIPVGESNRERITSELNNAELEKPKIKLNLDPTQPKPIKLNLKNKP